MGTQSATMTMKEFIAEHKIRLSCERVLTNPNMISDDKWMKQATHWRVQIWIDRKKCEMSIYYSMGSAHRGQPKHDDILDCIASDIAGVRNSKSFAEWAEEYGVEIGVLRKAQKSYHIILVQAQEFEKMLGPQVLEQMLYQVERL